MAIKIAFINGKGGCGKTTSIFHITGVLSKAGKKVLIIDFDKQRNTTDTLLMNTERPENTIYDVMHGALPESAVARVLFQSRGNAKPKYVGVDCLASDVRLEDEVALSQVDVERFGKKLDEFIQEWKYDWVLVDMPPSNRILNHICFTCVVDFLIVPFSSDVFSVSGYGDIIDTVQKARTLNSTLNILGVYLSRYMANCAVDTHVREKIKKFDTFIDIQIPLAADVRESIMFGRPISYYKEFSKSRRAYEDLVDEIKKRVVEFRKEVDDGKEF